MYRMRRPFEIESPGCSMIGAVAGFDPRVRIAPVGEGTRMLPVAVRSGTVGTESVVGASDTGGFREERMPSNRFESGKSLCYRLVGVAGARYLRPGRCGHRPTGGAHPPRAVPTRQSASARDGGEPLLEIGDQVTHILDADREAHDVLRHCELG